MAKTLIFLHIPKTAGTTFAVILERCYARSRVARVYPGIGLSVEELASLPPSRLAALDCVMGHFDFGLHRHLPGPAVYATFLRDPVRQVVSRYRHIQSSRWHPLHHLVRDGAPIEEFVRRLPGNYLTRALCDVEIEAGRPHTVLGEEHLARAKSNIEEHFALVGITERFDESVLLARHRCGLSDVRYVRRNVRGGGERPSLSARDRRAIDEETVLDRALYDWAQRRLDAEIAALGDGFPSELERYRQANARYARLTGPLHRLISLAAHNARLARSVAARLGRRLSQT